MGDATVSRGVGALQRKIIYWEGETPYRAYTNFVKVIVDEHVLA